MTKGTLIFDYDGTINETIETFEPSVRKAIEWLKDEKGIIAPEADTTRISRFLGMNARDMWLDFIPDLPDDVALEIRDVVGDEMLRLEAAGCCKWYEGIEEALTKFKEEGWNLAILSNCRTHHAKGHWDTFHLEKWFTKFYDCQSFGFAPKTEIIKTVMAEQPGPWIMIGDRSSDRDCAKAGGIKFIGCGYGYGSPEELEGSDIILESSLDLPSAVEKLAE